MIMAYFNTLANKEIEQPMDLNKNVIKMNRLLERKNHLIQKQIIA